MLATSSTTLWYTTRATGIVALVLLSVTLVLGILTAGRAKSRSWPAFAQADLHKRVSLLAMVFLTVHVLTAVLDTYVNVGWASLVVPFVSHYSPLWTGLGAVSLDLMVAVAVSSALRQRISARTWRGLHWLAYASWPVAMAHALGEGSDGRTLWMVVVAGVCIVAVLVAVAWRVGDHRRGRERSLRLGATTRGAAGTRSPPPPGGGYPVDPVAREGTGMSTLTVDPPARLIATRPGSAPVAGLDGHLAVHGPLTIPVGDDPQWSSAIGRAVAESGLRGRGGAAFPAAVKWDVVRRSSRRPLVVVNAMEGEPASAKDRMLLSHAPHLVLDGAEVAAAVIGGSEIVVCVPEHSAGATDSVARAISERTGAGRPRCRMSVLRPPGRYVTGEESALAGWLDGRRALPVLRVDKSVPLTAARSADPGAQRRDPLPGGPHRPPRTRVVPPSGNARSAGFHPGHDQRIGAAPGVVEVELGTPVADIVARAGVEDEPGAVLIGGYGDPGSTGRR